MAPRIPLPIETERLLIRAFRLEDDAEAMLEVYGDPEVMRYVPGGALSAEAVRSTLAGYAKAHERVGYAFWALTERASGLVVGDVGFGVFAPTGDVELGYTLARGVWGRGYATEAGAACLDAGFEQLQVPRIVAVVDADNERSVRVAERLGMARADSITAHGRPHLLFVASREPAARASS